MAMNANKYKTFNINEKTPAELFNKLNEEFSFDFDPCPLNPIPSFDGLAIPWGKSCFINPPYGKVIPLWLNKALFEIDEGNTHVAVFLLPSSTDVRWFHEIVLPKSNEIRFIKGRIKFGEHKEAAPFASMIVVFRKY